MDKSKKRASKEPTAETDDTVENKVSIQTSICVIKCDWIYENRPYRHKK